MNESNIVFETDSHYVYKVKSGHYQIRKNNGTHSLIVGEFNMPDEDNDARERAIEFCQDANGYELLREKYLN